MIREYDDKEDKRSKRIELTSKGEKIVQVCYDRIIKNAKMLMYDLTTDDKQLCIALLKNFEMKFSSLWPQHKGKTFEDVFSSVITKIILSRYLIDIPIDTNSQQTSYFNLF